MLGLVSKRGSHCFGALNRIGPSGGSGSLDPASSPTLVSFFLFALSSHLIVVAFFVSRAKSRSDTVLD